MRVDRRLIAGLVLLPFLLTLGDLHTKQQIPSDGIVYRARVEAPITPVSAGFIERAIREASQNGGVALVIELDTPGGLMESTRDIVKNILSSPVPIVVYVSPQGARAASAGVFITLASHVAAMAPATHIGAAHPVQIGGGPGQDQPDSEKQDGEHQGQSIMEEKIVNDARAWIRTLAELRGRNADWAESAVVRSESIVAGEALELNVIDFVAQNLPDLLTKMDGREVSLPAGPVTLKTATATIQDVEMWWGERILSLLSDPNLAFILLMLGFYGILLEFYTPGWGIAGTAGAICLILAFFGLAVLPVNFAGLLLVVVAIALFVAEAFFPSFGMLTVGGAVCLILGGVMLIDTPIPVMRVSMAVIIPIAVGSAAIAFFLATRAFQSFRLPIQTGAEAMVGMNGRATEDFEQNAGQYVGTVQVHGEIWRARSQTRISAGEAIVIENCTGLTLAVKRSADSVDRSGTGHKN